ncbi:MAG: T9SS type A sorting domain-containing protein [Chitinophagales bacterium]
MKRIFTLLTILMTVFVAKAQNQYSYNDAAWYIGTGADTAYMVVSFPQGSPYDPPASFLYGYLFNDSVQASAMMMDIDADDSNLHIEFSGGFVDSIALGTYQGKNGVGGFYWGIYSDTSSTDIWTSNAGSGEWIMPNEFYGLSFTDFAPAILPDTAVSVNNPKAFMMSDIEYWIGEGADSAVFVVDFLDGNSLAWGYMFDSSVVASEMMDSIAAADDSLTINIGSFLDDIIYGNIEGLAGAPNYWNTWSADNNGIWYTNIGIGETLSNGDWFGCSYPNYPPAIFPSTPRAAEAHVVHMAINNIADDINLSVFPNPTSGVVNFTADESIDNIELYNIQGILIKSTKETSFSLDVVSGVYFAKIYTAKGIAIRQLIIR